MASLAAGLLPEEKGRLEKRRRSVMDYSTPKWVSNHEDAVSGRQTEKPMVDHASKRGSTTAKKWF